MLNIFCYTVLLTGASYIRHIIVLTHQVKENSDKFGANANLLYTLLEKEVMCILLYILKYGVVAVFHDATNV